MAIGIGSIVAVKISSAVGGSVLAPGAICAQPPCFGVSESAAAPFTVVWTNSGVKTTALLATSVDEITDADTPTLALRGQVVGVVNASPAYSGLVIGAYQRSDVNYVLLQMSSGGFLEVLASSVAAVPGQ